MKNSSNKCNAATAPSVFRLSPIAAGAAAMLMGMGAQAQTAPSTQGADTQTITVTGIRRGIENAINIKKNSDSIVEAVSAEDIGKLPDSSIAESIARLPGLAAQRVNAAPLKSTFAVSQATLPTRCSMGVSRSAPATIAASSSTSTRLNCCRRYWSTRRPTRC